MMIALEGCHFGHDKTFVKCLPASTGRESEDVSNRVRRHGICIPLLELLKLH